MAAQFGLSLEEIMQVLSGEIVVTTAETSDQSQGIPELLIRLGIRKPAGSILAAMSRSGLLSPAGSGKYGISEIPGTIIRAEEKYIEIATSGFQTKRKTDSELKEFASGTPAQIICSINLEKIKDVLLANTAPAETVIAGNHWKNFRMRMDKDDAGNTRMMCSLTCKNEEDNSLFILMKSLNEISTGSSTEENEQKKALPFF
jgi:hypothetical protein